MVDFLSLIFIIINEYQHHQSSINKIKHNISPSKTIYPLTKRKVLMKEKESYPELLKYMLYYDLMVKLAGTDMGALFNLTANLERIDEEQETKIKLAEKYPKLNSAKNVHETLVDAYLLHFLGEMDPKMVGKDQEYLKRLETGKTDAREGKVEHLGKLESMRQLMRKKEKLDTDRSNQNLNILLGNLVKKRIMDRKQGNQGNQGSGGSQRKELLFISIFGYFFCFFIIFFLLF